ncbi:MAG: phospho-sugar mutase [Spirochaetota bacterium]
MDKSILDRARLWTTDRFDERTRAEIRELLDRGEEEELVDRFWQDLEFGTGGMRGVMGAGTNRMNVYTVGRATQGLAEHLIQEWGGEEAGRRGIVVAHDSRINSREFTREVARVMAANRITVHLFRDLRPVPLLSFAVRHLGCVGGVMITASHNPKEYNGYKVYGADGGQIISPEDTRIVEHVNSIDIAGGVHRMGYRRAVSRGLVQELDDRVERAYLGELSRFMTDLDRGLREELDRGERRVTVVYTPLHGTGITLLPDAVQRSGTAVRLVCQEEQSVPDGTFPTTPSPNPEDPEALSRAIDTAGREGADMVIATDPDCDRLGVAVPDGSGRFVPLTGNQLGCLFAHMIAASYRRSGLMPPDPVILSTIVSTEMVHRIAGERGIRVEEVLTGFKYIAWKIREFEEKGAGSFIFGFEESYGYLADTFVRDKDGVIGAMLAITLMRYAAGKRAGGAATGGGAGSPVLDLLYDLYRRHGLFMEFQRSFLLKGQEGARRIEGIMRGLRESPPDTLGGNRVELVKDYLEQKLFTPGDSGVQPITGLPRSNVLQFYAGDVKVSARPSGTEPKIKFYVALQRPVAGDIEQEQQRVRERYREVSGELFTRLGLEG